MPDRTRVRLPNVKLPSLGRGPRNPPGWSRSEISLRQKGLAQANRFQLIEPAGDPPAGWNGTRPEWAINWGLMRNGLDPETDFIFVAKLGGVGSSYFSTVDFLIRKLSIGIEVQGTYWHMGQGAEKQFHDIQRANAFASQDITVIFIDEPDALRDPEYFAREALAGRDHSLLAGSQ